MPLVYDELRKLASQKLAHEQSGQMLQATALVHEAICDSSMFHRSHNGTAAARRDAMSK
jgi:hypothetical protein